jgi:predicted phosphodiesterase
MAIYGVLGDIHGNREALAAALDELDDHRVQRIVCVGDIIGYNADSDACVEMLREREAICISGNHDLIGTGRLGFERCSNKARYSLSRTRRRLSAKSAAWLGRLPASRLVEDSIALVHGGVRDVQLYMTTAQHIRRNAELLRADFPTARACFFGHSHEQKLYQVAGSEVRELAIDERVELSREHLHFINAGSVDAQRKRAERLAECALFDSRTWTIEFLRVPYNSVATEAKATAAGYRIPVFTDWLYTWRRRLLAA